MQRIVSFAVAVLLLLQPIQCVVLPMNMALVDLASAVVLPLCWIWLAHSRAAVRLPYFPAMLLIFATTAAASITSLDPNESFTTLVKEIYLYLWFATISWVLEAFDPAATRRVLYAWLVAGLANGALVLAQFAEPSLLAAMNSALRGSGSLDPFRPSGLFENSNAAALFQLSIFVPLLALRFDGGRTMTLTAVLLAMMLGTGSMGAAMAFGLGAVVMLVGLILRRDWAMTIRLVGSALLATAIVGLVLAVLLQAMPQMQERLQYVLTGRSEYSAESRFSIWTRGSTALLADPPWLGIGPDMWKRIDGHELHNDLLSFAVERGPIALMGLILLAAMAATRSVQVVRAASRRDNAALLAIPAALVGMAAVSQTHEVFHQRPVWLILALLEATWWRSRTTAIQPMAAQPAGQASVPQPGMT